jgi:hypothetical protein
MTNNILKIDILYFEIIQAQLLLHINPSHLDIQIELVPY